MIVFLLGAVLFEIFEKILEFFFVVVVVSLWYALLGYMSRKVSKKIKSLLTSPIYTGSGC